MDKTLSNFFINENVEINLTTFSFNLIIVVLLTYLIKLVYNKYSQSLSNKDYFSKNFVVLGITTCIVITIVKSSLALSLGLVGALSIVRFRAAIKEPEELVYLFLVIATGLGIGANQVKITIVGIIVALIIVVFLSFFSNKKLKNVDLNIFQLSFILNQNITDELFSKILVILNKNCKEIDFISMSSDQNESSIHFEVSPSSVQTISKINKEFKNIKNLKIIFSRKNNISL
tara:strand:+ start:376 stop:1068 length:693 start_codon:yes stop_codon:yes gene_type:complete